MSTTVLPEFELDFRVIGPCFNATPHGEYFVVNIEGVPHAVWKYYRPGRLWLVRLDESKLRHLCGAEMDGLDTNEFGVAEYTGELGTHILCEGRLVKPKWASDAWWATDELFEK